jgi:hypothetical protein
MNKRIIFSIISLILLILHNVSSQELQWLKQAGGSAEDRGFGICVSDSGNIFVTGYFKSDGFFGTTKLKNSVHENIFIAKYDKQGRLKWANQAGSSNTDDDGQGIVVDSLENCYVIGFFEDKASFNEKNLSSNGKTDIFVAKYNSNGDILWVINLGGKGNDIGRSIAIDKLGNLFVVGKFEGSATFGNKTITSMGGDDIFLCKINNQGKVQWAISAGSKGNDDCFGVEVDNDGNSYITGGVDKNASFENKNFKGFGGLDIFIAKYSPEGKLLWAKNAGGESNENGRAIAIDNKNQCVYITGIFSELAYFDDNISIKSNGVYDVFIAKYNFKGELQWVKSAGGEDHEGGIAIAVDKNGNPYIGGYFKGTSYFDKQEFVSEGDLDIFIVKYNPEGKMIWGISGGGPLRDRIDGMTIDSNNNLYFTGCFEDNFSMSKMKIKSFGSKDIIIGKCLINR